jgi:hypothetical protein
MSVTLLPLPQPLRPFLPTIVGNVDYRKMRDELLRIDELLTQSGTEQQFIGLCVEQWEANCQAADRKPSVKAQLTFQKHSRRALRCNILRTYLEEDFRDFAARLADSPLFQFFCGLAEIDRVVIPAKSTLQRYAHWVPESTLKAVVAQTLRQAHHHPKKLQLAQPANLEVCFLDTTCLKANIHYPVDWVLLRDATRTLMKAVALIRAQGLRHRMEEPALFRKRMNCLCMEMAHVPRKTDSKRHRKKVLRKMDRLVGSVARHAKRYRQLLDKHWEKTAWTQPQTQQVLRRLDGVLQQLPAARKQARQRIIQEQPVANEDKILSLYEAAVNVVVRRKAGVEVEFGNTFFLAESLQGLIMDWELFEKSAPADSRMVGSGIDRIQQNLQIQIKQVGADRGFHSASNQEKLAKNKTYNAIAPRDPRKLKQRMDSWKFVKLQRRRSQIEGRISIVVRNFLGSPMRCKGFDHRQLAVGWGVLTHNLWVLARLPKRKAKRPPASARRLAA